MNASTRVVGIEIFYFMDRWADDQASYFHLARECGYDGVEISLMPHNLDDHHNIRNQLQAHDLSIVCATGLGADTDISHPDPAIRRAGIEYLKRCLDTASKVGSPILGGVTFAPWFGFPSEEDLEPYRERSAVALREVATAADAVGVDICVEVLNRFETFMFNTADQANAFIDLVGHSAMKIELDTFHMNMEEANLPDAVRSAGARLGYFQCAAGNRFMPGKGHVDWDGIAVALDEIGYQGWVSVETFPNPLVETGRSTHAWRPLVSDSIGEAKEAAIFLRDRLGGE